jgi:LacI family transcriptional regulator
MELKGAARGVGEAIAYRVAGEGARVTAVDQDSAGLGRLKERAQAQGFQIQAVVADIGTAEGNLRAVAAAETRFSILRYSLICAVARRPRGSFLTVRMKDIAEDLGISPMAVSKALRGHKDISEETKARVLARAKALNYRLDWVARSMVTGRTYLVGLVIPDLKQSFFAEIATAVEATLAPAGYHVLISHTDENAAEEVTNIDLMVSRRVDGLLIASAQRESRPLSRLKTPYVLIDRRIAGLNADFVGARNDEIGFIATEHLIEQGYRRIAHLKGPRLSPSTGRARGYRRALEQHRIALHEEWVIEAGHDDAAGYRAMQMLLALRPRPDAVFCFNDPVAVGALRAILEAGLSVPRDVALVGVANMHYSDLLTVPLSTVDQGTTTVGQKAAQRLLQCMSAGRRLPPEELLVPPKLIARVSSLKKPH